MGCSLPGSSSLGFFKQEYWNGFPFPTPGDRPDPGIELMSPVSPALQVVSLPSKALVKPPTPFPRKIEKAEY